MKEFGYSVQKAANNAFQYSFSPIPEPKSIWDLFESGSTPRSRYLPRINIMYSRPGRKGTILPFFFTIEKSSSLLQLNLINETSDDVQHDELYVPQGWKSSASREIIAKHPETRKLLKIN